MAQFPFQLVGFDLDGTMFDTSGDLGAAVNYVMRELGRDEIPLNEVPVLVGKGARVMLDRALDRSGGSSEELLDTWLPRLIDFYADNLTRHTRPYPGLLDALEALAAEGVRLAICTNKREGLARGILKELDLGDRFVAVVGGDTLGPGHLKPLPDLVLEMVRQAGGGTAAFVGDTFNDIDAAKAANIPSVAVTFGFSDRPVDSLGADAMIDHYDELVPALKRLS
jgi:phosphoglycolate phosphatase